jgi:hypothetical protein
LATDRLFCHYAPERDLLAALQALNKEHARNAKGAKRDIWWLHLPWPQPVYTKGSAWRALICAYRALDPSGP